MARSLRGVGPAGTVALLLTLLMNLPPFAAAARAENTEAPASGDTACPGAQVAAKIVAVPDARTLRLDDGRELRLAGIEPFSLLLPEPGDAEAQLKERLSALVTGGSLTTIPAGNAPDRYGRTPALVFVGGDLLQTTLAREGLAVAFATGDPLPCFGRILAAEDEARRLRRGFWAETSVAPAFPNALAARVGRFAVFEGKVVSVGDRPQTSYIDFGQVWSKDVTIEIPAKLREALGGEAAVKALAGARVRARGFLVEKGGPMLSLRSAMQLEILQPATNSARVPP